MAQCFYVASHAELQPDEIAFASPGPQYAGREFSKPPDPSHSPLIYHIAQFPVRHGTVPWFDFMGPRYQYRWLLRLPFVIIALLRGAALWYVARRLYGAWPGAFALALYCFSPRMVAEGSHIWPDALASWGFFGVVFMSIASAHTLYANRATLPWNDRWRRPILMGVALGLAVAAQFTTWISLPLAIAFLLYLVPGRRREASAMLAACAAIGFIVVVAIYRFSFAALWHDVADYALSVPHTGLAAYVGQHHDALREAVHSTNYGLFALTIAGLLFWLISRRARWFGNTSSLIALIAVLLFTCAGSTPELVRLWSPATAFLFMFLGGIFADALDSPRRKVFVPIALVLLLAHIAFGLARTLAVA